MDFIDVKIDNDFKLILKKGNIVDFDYKIK